MTIKRKTDANTLRPYQEKILNQMKKSAFSQKGMKAYLSIPPGGGKTLVAIEFVAQRYLKEGKKILWLAWDWVLLEQAFDTLSRQYRIDEDEIGTAFNTKPKGIKFTSNINRLTKQSAKPLIVFTTPRIWVNGIGSLSRSFKPDLIVIDEAHYGINGEYDKPLKDYIKRNGVNVLGLSGTPKKRADWSLINPQITFKQLVIDKYLAEPVLDTIKTGQSFEGRIRSGNIDSQTIKELCGSRKRNLKIVEYVKNNSKKLGKTVIFTGRQEHADELADMLSSYGAISIHGDIDNDDPKEAISEFKKNNYKIAICVNMLRQGVDIPDVNTVIIAVPTTSDIAYFQMACRGNRITTGKTTFNLIDVQDTFNNENFKRLLVQPTRFFSGGGSNSDREITNTTLLSRRKEEKARPNNKTFSEHSYESGGHTYTFEYDELAPICFQRLNGIRINKNQTFGVECELTHKNQNYEIRNKEKWLLIANQILEGIQEIIGKNKTEKKPLFTESEKSSIDYSKWNVVSDSSCGWEIVSPILKGKEGIEDLVTLFHHFESKNIFQQLDLEVNQKTGLHVHLGWNYQNLEQTKTFIHATRKFSPALYSLVAPSRLENTYCQPIRKFFPISKINKIKTMNEFKQCWVDHETRYHDINLRGIRNRVQTFEVRLHSGTYDGTKIASWIGLWMNLAHFIDRPGARPEVDSSKAKRKIEFTKHEDSDIVAIAVKYFGIDPKFNKSFLERLHNRRQDVFGNEHWRIKLDDKTINEMLEYWSLEFQKIVG
jgi:superfamily II DNA or RNA helicase